MTRLQWICYGLALSCGLAILPVIAFGHDWYPFACCSDKDCWPTESVTATASGWIIHTSGEVIPYDDPRVKDTPPEASGFHVCHIGGDPTARALCLFVPGAGV
jgi:hypothetical protein